MLLFNVWVTSIPRDINVFLWGSQSDHKREQSSADTMIISIFGGFAVVHWTFAPPKLYNKYWLDCFYKGRWPTGKFCGWQSFQSQWEDSEEDVMPTNYKSTSPPPIVLSPPPSGPSRLKTEMRPMGLCVGSMQVSVNIVFSQTHCHKQKNVINQLRHRHRRSCAFHQSRKQNRENICTQIQLSATQAASCSTG